jgi:hypothetical protein
MTESIRNTRLSEPDAQDVDEATELRRRAELNRRDEKADRVSDVDDVSPHHEGRAQPGDVLGIETGGETTEIGDTAEDENERRRKLEKDGK